MKIGKLPEWSLWIAKKLYDQNLFKKVLDQLIVNEYLPG